MRAALTVHGSGWRPPSPGDQVELEAGIEPAPDRTPGPRSGHQAQWHILVTSHCLHPPMNFPPDLLDLGAAKDGPILRIDCSGDPATTHGHAPGRVLRSHFGKGARWDCSVLHDRGTCPHPSRHRTHAFCPARPRDRPRTRCLLRCSATASRPLLTGVPRQAPLSKYAPNHRFHPRSPRTRMRACTGLFRPTRGGSRFRAPGRGQS